MRLKWLPLVVAAAWAQPAAAEGPCDQLLDKIKDQQQRAFLLNVNVAASSAVRASTESLQFQMQLSSLMTAMLINTQVAIASKCDVSTVLADENPNAIKAAICGVQIRTAEIRGKKADLVAAYRAPECGGIFETPARNLEAEMAKAQSPRPAPKGRESTAPAGSPATAPIAPSKITVQPARPTAPR